MSSEKNLQKKKFRGQNEKQLQRKLKVKNIRREMVETKQKQQEVKLKATLWSAASFAEKETINVLTIRDNSSQFPWINFVKFLTSLLIQGGKYFN